MWAIEIDTIAAALRRADTAQRAVMPADAQVLTAGVVLVGAGRLAVNDLHLDSAD